MTFELGEVISIVGNVSSVAALILTVWILLTVKGLRDYYVFRATVPDILRKLGHHKTTILRHLQQYEAESIPRLETLAGIRALIKNLERKLPTQHKASTTRLLRLIQHDWAQGESEDILRRIYSELVTVIDEVTLHYEDSEWHR